MSAVQTASNRVLLLRWDDSDVARVERVFADAGFPVDSVVGRLGDADVSGYGALVHVARTADDLYRQLGDQRHNIREPEWVLIEGDGERDFHCTVQLTESASTGLRLFVAGLWGQATVT